MPDVSELKLILGSASPRRLELLQRLGLEPAEIRAPDVDEAPLAAELPRTYCRRITAMKAVALLTARDEVILCADTTVALGRKILGKPSDAAEAHRFLEQLSGRRHRVITSVAVSTSSRTWQRDCVSQVRMKRLSGAEIEAYIATGDWVGKAGAYGIQGQAGAFIPWMSGSFPAIMGLPLTETMHLLRAAGLRVLGAP